LPFVLILASCSASIVACAGKQKTAGDPDGDKQTSAADDGLSSCSADPQWLLAPSVPSEIPGTASICNFEQFMWQSMLALVQPSANNKEVLEFETWMPSYGIFVKAGQPTSWGQHPPDACSTPPGTSVRTGEAPRLYSNIIKQAGANQPLMDPSGEFVYYGMSVNKGVYDMLTGCQLYKSHCAGPLKPGNTGIDIIDRYPNLAYPDGAVVLKTSWMVLDEQSIASGLFYSVPGWIQDQDGGACRSATLGLTGMHIVAKTPSTPAFVWATFEQRNNAPDCDDKSAASPLGGSWNFYKPDCADCPTNTYEAARPAQVCRMHPQGDSHIGTFPGGVDCNANPNQFTCGAKTVSMLDESTQAIKDLNAGVQQLIRDNPDSIDPVWANYELVGNVWTVGGTLPPYLQAQHGSLAAANTSMETFVQNGVADVTNPYSCFSCHNMEGPEAGRTLPPVGLSHLFDSIEMSGGCDDDSLPTTCSPYYTNP
jgi:hypothetical protein